MALVITFIEPRKDKPPLGGVQAPVEKYQIILLNHSLSLISSKCSLYYKNRQEEYSK